jgi:hypothetical protein
VVCVVCGEEEFIRECRVCGREWNNSNHGSCRGGTVFWGILNREIRGTRRRAETELNEFCPCIPCSPRLNFAFNLRGNLQPFLGFLIDARRSLCILEPDLQP